jgi:membrane protein DedA with SNARE-associated domain
MRETLLYWVEAYGLPIVGLAVLPESAGVPIPGETALLLAAAAAGAGRLSLWAVVAVAAVAAIVGDAGGYWLGRRGGRPFLERHGRWLHLDRATFDRLETFFRRHGPKAVFFGRFVGVLRTYTALFAGVSRMPYGTFTLFNAAGGVVWAGLFGGLGYLFGQQLAAVERVLRAVGGIIQDILAQDPLVLLDAGLATTLQGWATPLATTVLRSITRLASAGGLAVLTGILVAGYGRRGQWLQIAAWIGTVGGGEALLYLFKLLLARPRPPIALRLVAAAGDSFPSGHAMMALVAYGLLAYSLLLKVASWRRRAGVVSAAVVVILLVGFSRLYLGVHYLSDVLGGYAAGLVWLGACVTAAELIRRGDLGVWWRLQCQGGR